MRPAKAATAALASRRGTARPTRGFISPSAHNFETRLSDSRNASGRALACAPQYKPTSEQFFTSNKLAGTFGMSPGEATTCVEIKFRASHADAILSPYYVFDVVDRLTNLLDFHTADDPHTTRRGHRPDDLPDAARPRVGRPGCSTTDVSYFAPQPNHIHGHVDAPGASSPTCSRKTRGSSPPARPRPLLPYGEPVAAMTLQPACAASSTAANPTPPAAAVINTVSPSLIRARRRRAMSAVP